MPQMDFFPQRPEVHPMIYAYRDLNPDYDGLLKVGYTEKDVDRRVAQQYPTKRPVSQTMGLAKGWYMAELRKGGK